MKSVSTQLEDFLRSHKGEVFASGDLQRMSWSNRNGSLATPRSIVRRLEELAEEGVIKVEYKERNHAHYTYGERKTLRWVFDEVTDPVTGLLMRRPRQVVETV